jgi:Flp pilus assembly protein TadG
MRMRTRAAAGDRDRGAITLMLLALMVMLLALAGIVIDGGAKLRAAANAAAIAQEAARAGAGVVNQSAAYSRGTFVINQPAAMAAARAYLASGRYTGTVAATGPRSIRVTVTVTQATRALSIIGITSMTSTGSAVARLVSGVTGPGT